MKELRFATTVERSTWNALLGRSDSGHFFQTWQWAALAKEMRGSEQRFFTLCEDNNRALGGLLLQREHLGTDAASRAGRAAKLLPLMVYRWQHGPFLTSSGEVADDFGTILGAVEEKARLEGALAIEGVNLAGYVDAFSPNITTLMREMGYKSNASATYLVDLTIPGEELFNVFDRSVRKNVRRCRQKGLKVERVTSKEGWLEFANLFMESRRRQGLFVPSQRYVLGHNELLNQAGERLAELFLARYNGRALGALLVLAFNGWLTEAMSATSAYALKYRLPAQDFLKWEIIQWGKERGHHTFDLAGVAVKPMTAKEEGIRRFKAKFGGRYVEYFTYTKAIRPVAYGLVESLRRWRS